MVNLFNRNSVNRLIYSVVLSTFTVCFTLPAPSVAFEINFNEVAFMARLEKLVDRLVNSESKGIDRMIGCLVDIKSEIETSYNIRIDVDKYMNEVSKEINKKGIKTPRREFDLIKRKIKARDHKNKVRCKYIESTMYMEGYQFNELDMQLFMASKDNHKHKEEKEEKEEVVIPAGLVYGVSMALCGFFLTLLPIPVCKEWGPRMVTLGIGACANSLCSKTDENNKKDQDKKDRK